MCELILSKNLGKKISEPFLERVKFISKSTILESEKKNLNLSQLSLV